MLLLGGIALLIIGILMIIARDEIYEIVESWKNNSASSPSDLYKLNTRIGGIMFSIVGLAGIIVYFIS